MKVAGFDWDDGNRSKCVTLGVSLAETEALFRGEVYVVGGVDFGPERRALACGEVGGRWVFCVLTMRRGRIRPVSVRYMHAKEVRRYAEEISRSRQR